MAPPRREVPPMIMTAAEEYLLRRSAWECKRLEEELERARETRQLTAKHAASGELLRIGDSTKNRTTWAMTSTKTAKRAAPIAVAAARKTADAKGGGECEAAETRLVLFPDYLALAEGEVVATIVSPATVRLVAQMQADIVR